MGEPEVTLIATEGPKEQVAIMADEAPRFMAIHSQVDLDQATTFLHQIASVKARIKEVFRPQIAKAWDLHKSLIAEEKKFTDKLDDVDGKVRTKVAEYVRQQDELRFEAERLAARAKAKIEKVSEAAVDKAHELIDGGKLEEADRAIEQAKEKIAGLKESVVIPPKAEAAGVQVKQVWTFEIVNPDRVPTKFKKPDLVAIGAFVTRFKDQAWKHLPGVRVFTKDVVAVRNGK